MNTVADIVLPIVRSACGPLIGSSKTFMSLIFTFYIILFAVLPVLNYTQDYIEHDSVQVHRH